MMNLAKRFNLQYIFPIWYNGSKGGGKMYVTPSDNQYIAIIGDIIDSKKIEDRNKVQNKLKNILCKLNTEYSKDIAAKFCITLGDEFQGLLKKSENVMKMILEIEMAMTPIQIRFGIGMGTINTEINYENSSEIDGNVYHRARKMIKKIEHKKSQYSEPESNIMISTEDDNIELDELLNSILSVCTALKSKWTERQIEIIHAYLLNSENQYKAAYSLRIGQSSVNKSLKKAKFYSYQSAINTVNKFLNKKWRNDD